MSEQQPQHEPWIQPPAGGAPDAQPQPAGQAAGGQPGGSSEPAAPYVGPAQQQPAPQQPAQQPPTGQPYAGQPYQGQAYPGQPYASQQQPGQPYPGQPAGGQPYPGQPAGGQPYPAYPPQAYAQQPYPGYPGQPYAWQQHPYAGRPHQAPHPPYAGMPYYPVPQHPLRGVAVDPRRKHLRRLGMGAGALAVIAASLAVGVAFGVGTTHETAAVSGGGSSSSTGVLPGGSGSSSGGTSTLPYGGSGGSSNTNPGNVPGYGYGYGDGDGTGSSGGAFGGSSSGTAQGSGAVAATAAQEKGVVTINSQLQYQQATSAGTGMILSSDGLVLTNNHVVNGATAIRVTVETTGKQYTATVVGTDPSADVALLQLQGASGLTPVTLDTGGGVSTGSAVTAIGNAEGTGNLVAAAGSITGTDQTMTAQTELGGSAETLSGLLEFQASVVSGDSGGPVLDAQGEVVGMTTAASNGAGPTDAYAITITNALSVVHQIQAGDTAGGRITLGYPAFLGVALSSQQTQAGGFGQAGGTTNGATISGVIAGTPAASAGLAAGDTITALDGTAVTSSTGLSTAMSGHKAGDRVSLTWVSGTTGTSHTATVTLVAGPAN